MSAKRRMPGSHRIPKGGRTSDRPDARGIESVSPEGSLDELHVPSRLVSEGAPRRLEDIPLAFRHPNKPPQKGKRP